MCALSRFIRLRRMQHVFTSLHILLLTSYYQQVTSIGVGLSVGNVNQTPLGTVSVTRRHTAHEPSRAIPITRQPQLVRTTTVLHPQEHPYPYHPGPQARHRRLEVGFTGPHVNRQGGQGGPDNRNNKQYHASAPRPDPFLSNLLPVGIQGQPPLTLPSSDRHDRYDQHHNQPYAQHDNHYYDQHHNQPYDLHDNHHYDHHQGGEDIRKGLVIHNNKERVVVNRANVFLDNINLFDQIIEAAFRGVEVGTAVKAPRRREQTYAEIINNKGDIIINDINVEVETFTPLTTLIG